MADWLDLYRTLGVQTRISVQQADGSVREIAPRDDLTVHDEFGWADHFYLGALKSYLKEAISLQDEKGHCAPAETVREFLRTLHDESAKVDYWTPVWDGLLQVKNDETLLKATIALLEHMWV